MRTVWSLAAIAMVIAAFVGSPASRPIYAQQSRPPAELPKVPVRNLQAPRPNAPQQRPATGAPATRAPAAAAGAPATAAGHGGVTGQPPRNPAVQGAQAVGPPRAAAPGTARLSPPVMEEPQVVRAPFQLSPQEQQALDQVLLNWQQHSQKMKSFTCTLTRWEWDDVFQKKTVGLGDLNYSAPDRGLYRVKNKETGEMIDHWVCDGESIYEFNYTKKEVIQRVLPANMRGKAIADGPLPFIFGADAAKLKQRYWMRLIKPPPKQEGKICLEAYPRTQQDAANFKRAELLLSPKDMLPYALHIDLTNGKNWTVHQFTSIVTNDPLRGIKDLFTAPRVLPPWKKVLDNPETVEPEESGNSQAEQARAAPRTLPK